MMLDRSFDAASVSCERTGNSHLFAMLQLVQSSFLGDVGIPELAVGGTTGHRAEHVVIDLDDLSDAL